MEIDTPATPGVNRARAFWFRARGWATLIAAATALMVTITKTCSRPNEPGAKASYDELSSAVKANSEELAKNHDDIVGLRGYVDGIVKVEGVTPPPHTSATPPVSASVAMLVPIERSKLHPPPAVGTRPLVFEPKGFDTLQTDQMKK